MDSERRIATVVFADVSGLPTASGADSTLTLVFADVSGFTAMSEVLDPEDVRDIMNRCFTVLEQAVHVHGGAVEQYLGDCIVAVFGTPAVGETGAPAAVRAAVAMRAAIDRIRRELVPPQPLDVHIGVATGRALAAQVGGEVTRRVTVMGEAVDLASHLKDASPKGAIWLSAETHAATRALFARQPVQPILHDGRQVPVYEIVATVEEAGAAGPLPGPTGGPVVAADPGTAGEDTMNRCFAILERVVRDHGGYVDKYIGHGAMALFGVPAALENAPRAAVNAAIAMRNALRTATRDGQLPAGLDLKVGVNTGLVFAGDVGGDVRREFTVMGDAVNLAARLKDASPLGAIWVGPQTHRHTADAFEYRALPAMTLKNKRHPLAVHEVLSVRETVHRPGPERDRMIFSDLVGRERELEEIRERFEHLLEGRGGIVTILGDAGLGKSRLLAEMAALDEMKGVLRLEGRSVSVGRTFSFHPFADLLRRWAGILEDEPEGEAFRKLETAVAALVSTATSEVLPFVATLMGLQLSGVHAERVEGIEGDALERLTVNAMRELFQAMATAWPLVLVFEDLHWADESSVMLLESLLRLATEMPVLFVLVLRPDRQQPAQRIVDVARSEFGRRHTEIVLAPLDAKQCDRLIRNLLKIEDLPYATRTTIARKADGNPFFIEEIIRSLIDQGAIEHEGGVFRVTEKIGQVVIPGTIQEVILTRVERLPERAQKGLRIAAVIGRSFPYRLLAEIAGPDAIGGLDWDLRHLQRRQMIAERETQQGEREYVFTHAVAQETIYESISQRTRRTMHGQIAAAIEMLYAERLPEFYGMLAYHYSRAERLVEAEDYLFKAGDEAARAAASSEALAFFQEASHLYFRLHGEGGDPRRKALLEKNIGLALLNRGQLLESLDHFNTALAHLGEPLPQRPLAVQARFVVDLAVLLARIYTSGGKPPMGRERPSDRESVEIRYNRHRAQSTSDPKRLFIDTIGSVRRLVGTDPRGIEQASGMYAAVAAAFAFAGISFRLSRRLLGIAQALARHGNVRDDFVFRSFQFLVDYFEGRWTLDSAMDPGLLEQGLRYGLAWDATTYLGLHCERAIVQGDFDGAERDIARLARMVDEGFEFARSSQYYMSAYLPLEQRRLGPALLAINRYVGDRQEDALTLFGLGTRAQVEVLSGAVEAAGRTLAQAEVLLGRLGIVPPYHLSPYTTARLLHDVAAVERALRGDRNDLRRLVAQARRSRRKALRLAASIAREQAQTYQLAGRLSWILGRHGQAARHWRRGLATAERLGMRPALARLHLEIAQRLAEPGSQRQMLAGLDAAGHRERARALLTALGLQWDLVQLAATRRAA